MFGLLKRFFGQIVDDAIVRQQLKILTWSAAFFLYHETSQ